MLCIVDMGHIMPLTFINPATLSLGESWELGTDQSMVCRATTLHQICKDVKLGIQLACLHGILVS